MAATCTSLVPPLITPGPKRLAYAPVTVGQSDLRSNSFAQAPGYAPQCNMPAEDFHAVGIVRTRGRDRSPADMLARVLLLSCLTTALPIPFVREWGVLVLFLGMAVGNRRFAAPNDLPGLALLALATWAVIGAASMALRIAPWWIFYEEVPCALQVLVVSVLAPRVIPDDLDRALGRLTGGFLIGALFLSTLAMLLYLFHRNLGPAMDSVFALAGSNRVAEVRASLRSDYNAFAVGLLVLAGAGSILIVPRRRVCAAVVLLLACAVALLSDSRRVLLLIAFVLPLICLAWWGLRRSVLKLGALALAGAFALTFATDLQWSDILAPRITAFLEKPFGSLDEFKSAIMRDGMWEWGLSQVGAAPPLQWLFGFGFEHMLELGGMFPDPREPNQTYGYVHNVLLGTMLTFGTVGLTCLLAAMLGALRRIGHLLKRPSGQILAMLLVSGLVLGFWSGNTVFSIPPLAVGLAVSLKVQGEEGRVIRKSRS